jgi:DNA-binding MarR family transcriptional regulator
MSANKTTRAAAAVSPTLAQGESAFRAYLTAEMMLGQQSAKAVGLSGADFFGLNIIALCGSVSAGELAERTGLTSGATTRMIDRLEAAGWVRRVHGTQDRRKVMVEHTDQRRAEVEAALEPGRRHIGELLQTYDEAQLAVLFDYFTRATPALLAAIEELRRTGKPQE